MRTKWSTVMVMLALVLVACTQGSRGGSTERPAAAAHDLLFVDTGDGMQALNAGTGHVSFNVSHAVATPDWTELFTTAPDGKDTVLETLDPMTGAVRSRVSIHGNFVPAVAAADGESVALVEPGAEGAFPGLPEGRADTRLAVADPSDPNETLLFHLHGNFEPDAFSTNDRVLYMLEYFPALAPELYRVMWLDLRSGKVWPAPGPDKGAVAEKMAGTRITRAISPDHDTLYTLYTNQNPAYSGSDGMKDVAFVHTLSLEYGWAVCIDLPRSFGPGSANGKTLAISPDGSRLYVVDATRGLVSVVNTEKRKVVLTERVDLGGPAGGIAAASVGSDGTLYVGAGSTVIAIDGDDLQVLQRWTVAGTITGLGLGSDGDRLYVAAEDRIAELDLPSGGLMGAIPSPGVEGIRYVAPLAG